MPLSPRQRAILLDTVEEFLGGGAPVGSETLCANARLRWSPATVRAEFAVLEHCGYLNRAHRSAGRVPTTAGYRAYVNERVRPEADAWTAAALTSSRNSWEETGEAAAENLAPLLAEQSGLLSIVAVGEPTRYAAGRPGSLHVREAGFRRLLDLPEFVGEDLGAEVGRLLDYLGGDDVRPFTGQNATPTVYIDGENPFAPTARVSMVVSAPLLPNGIGIFAALVGPLRMSYGRAADVLQALAEVADDSSARRR